MNPINNILVATDLSKESDSLIIYATEFAKVCGAKLFVLHSYHVPVPASEASFLEVSSLEEGIKNNIREKFSRIKKDFFYSDLPKYEFLLKQGSVEETITDTADEKRVDLIMMGTEEPNELFELFGTHTTSIAKKSRVPVLVIPNGIEFKGFKKILFACDLRKLSTEIDILTFIAQKYRAQIEILTVEKKLHILKPEEMINENTVHHLLESSDYQHFYRENEDIEMTIENYIRRHYIDLLVVTPHHHSIWERINQKSLTKKLLLHAGRPILVLPE